MEKMIGYCGLVCTECLGFLATQADDDAQRAQVAQAWSQEYGGQLKPEDINCDGCQLVGGRHFSYCGVCDVRKCALERGVANCAYCADYPCSKLGPQFRALLDEIRAGP